MGTDAGSSLAQALASVYIPLRSGEWFAAVEPLLRVGWTTTETAAGTDYRALFFTPGVSLYVAGKNWMGLNLDWYDTNQVGPGWSLKTQAFVYF